MLAFFATEVFGTVAVNDYIKGSGALAEYIKIDVSLCPESQCKSNAFS